MPLELAAGIDAGKAFLDLAIAPSGRSLRARNAPQGIATILQALRRAGVRRVVLEAIGPYTHRLVHGLAAAGFEVGLVNPRRIKAFREAEGRHAKTDRLDAALIARFALRMADTLRPLPSAAQLAAKALAGRRRQLVEMIAAEKTRLKQTDDPDLVASHRLAIDALASERDRIEAKLDQALAADPDWAAKLALLTSIPGIGKQVATVLLTDLPELGTLNRRTAASLAGLAPHPNQSGLAPGRNAIAGGRPCVRAALYMAALSAARHQPNLRVDYAAMRQAGKPAKVALVAVARKLLTIANAVTKTNQPYAAHLTSTP
jgi:transposase